jgi:uncharacterized protein YkwD
MVRTMNTLAKVLAPLACSIAIIILPLMAFAAPPDAMMASRVIELVNQARQQRGLAPLVMNEKLMQAAQAFAVDLAQRRTLSHVDASGRGIGQRFLALDYVYSLADEAVGGGQPTAEALVGSLLTQPGNADTLMNPDARDAGVGIAARPDDTPSVGLGTYWVIDLGLQVERGPGP